MHNIPGQQGYFRWVLAGLEIAVGMTVEVVIDPLGYLSGVRVYYKCT